MGQICLPSLLVMHWGIFASCLCILGWDLKVLFSTGKPLPWVDRARIKHAMAAMQLSKLFLLRTNRQGKNITQADYHFYHQEEAQLCCTAEQTGVCLASGSDVLIRPLIYRSSQLLVQLWNMVALNQSWLEYFTTDISKCFNTGLLLFLFSQ